MEIALPATASRRVMQFDDQSGRDQVANMAKGDWAAFERPLPAILHACVRCFPGLVIDVGANTGYYALLAALSCNARRVIAFEPDASVAQLLVQNVTVNNLQTQIEISGSALSDRNGTASLYVPTQEHGLVETSSSLEASFKSAHSEIQPVKITTLDAYLGRLRAFFSKISIIKIDVEGHEAAVLKGAMRVIRRWRPILFVEVLSGADTGFLSKLINDLGYTDFPLMPGDLRKSNEVMFVPEAWNHALVPTEKVQQFRSAVNA